MHNTYIQLSRVVVTMLVCWMDRTVFGVVVIKGIKGQPGKTCDHVPQYKHLNKSKFPLK